MKRGRPKGYSPYVEISYEDLADYGGRKTLIKVCKTWIEDLIEQTKSQNTFLNTNTAQTEHQPKENKEYPKIEYELTTFE